MVPRFLHWITESKDYASLLNYPAAQKQYFQKPNISLQGEKHGHVDCLFLFAQDHNPKSKEAKMNHQKEEFSHPLGNCGYHPLDKAVTP